MTQTGKYALVSAGLSALHHLHKDQLECPSLYLVANYHLYLPQTIPLQRRMVSSGLLRRENLKSYNSFTNSLSDAFRLLSNSHCHLNRHSSIGKC
jgi:hypothetical protein